MPKIKADNSNNNTAIISAAFTKILKEVSVKKIKLTLFMFSMCKL